MKSEAYRKRGGHWPPGEGSVSPYRMKDGTERWAITLPGFYTDNGHRTTRRRGPQGERWFTREQALAALAQAKADGAAVPLPPVRDRRRLRLDRGLSIKAVARAVGVCPKAVRNWETGRSAPTREHGRRYAAALTGR